MRNLMQLALCTLLTQFTSTATELLIGHRETMRPLPRTKGPSGDGRLFQSNCPSPARRQ